MTFFNGEPVRCAEYRWPVALGTAKYSNAVRLTMSG